MGATCVSLLALGGVWRRLAVPLLLGGWSAGTFCLWNMWWGWVGGRALTARSPQRSPLPGSGDVCLRMGRPGVGAVVPVALCLAGGWPVTTRPEFYPQISSAAKLPTQFTRRNRHPPTAPNNLPAKVRVLPGRPDFLPAGRRGGAIFQFLSGRRRRESPEVAARMSWGGGGGQGMG